MLRALPPSQISAEESGPWHYRNRMTRKQRDDVAEDKVGRPQNRSQEAEGKHRKHLYMEAKMLNYCRMSNRGRAMIKGIQTVAFSSSTTTTIERSAHHQSLQEARLI